MLLKWRTGLLRHRPGLLWYQLGLLKLQAQQREQRTALLEQWFVRPECPVEVGSEFLADMKLWSGQLLVWRMRTGFDQWWFERMRLVRVQLL